MPEQEQEQVLEDAGGMWAIVELMGHVKLAGWVTEEERFGAKLGRIDIPGPDGGAVVATQYFSGSSLYRLTPVSEDLARAFAAENQPRPVQRWELPARVDPEFLDLDGSF